MRFLVLLVLVSGMVPSVGMADDWPGWLGPRRDSVWRETGLLERFPEEGLSVKWRVPVQLGYAGPAVAAGKVFLFDYLLDSGSIKNNPGSRVKLQGRERLLCLDAATGRTLWKHEYACAYGVSYPSGPRCTPTVDGQRVYTLGTEGHLRCLRVADGKLLWSRNFTEDYEVETPIWGFAAHPLVDGDYLYCVVGGEGSVAVAFDKRDGREVWRALSAGEPGYCPPTMIQHAGCKQLLIWHPDAVNSLDPLSGKVYWSIPLKPDYSMSIAAPRLLGDYLFASGIGNVGALMKLDRERPAAEVVWRGRTKMAVYCANSTPFLEDGVIYGADCRSGALVAARIDDGTRLWETYQPTTGARRAGHGTAFLVKNRDRFFLFSESGDLILARLTAEGYDELDRFHVLEPTGEAFGRDVVWSHPAFAHRAMFARNDQELVCVNLAAE
ncbi:MAG: PQQ-binding-like beta-propeller repeat protein [Planctomycetales bacterium]|nr:PQQ-binding-like beta-propeller repeat protein [Planctomycetales bacterium]NIM08765.1 PQQ-binding-like beta-propeller repeat protein [Planctomycetales bacterium]NIN08228.1 PQQ-binding-like beta-propeller repeat protein [Planctomycetales bacterium]NIN77356.1 PQQ-binding-like beta-propeller repeat protein [Planctomycetales bacterium]NIO34539.1 PQQ-binding-like beta-propeller repeat protein [Planctomycetales bacterium]